MFKIILWSDYFERTLVWTMVWYSSGQWSGTCLIRGHFGLELAWSEAASSALRAHNDLRAHSRLIRGHFGLGRSDQRSHLSGTVWSEAISSATSTWVLLPLGSANNSHFWKIQKSDKLTRSELFLIRLSADWNAHSYRMSCAWTVYN